MDPNAAATTTTTPAPGSPEHDAAMAARFDASQGTTPPASTTTEPARPEGLPAEFKSMADFQAAYDALKAGTKPPEGDKKPDLTVPEKPPETAEAAAAALKDKGLNFETFAANYAKNGKVTEDDYAALAAAGIPKALVDGYVAGQEAQATAMRNDVFTSVGGEETYTKMVQWASSGAMSKDEVDAYNTAVNSGNLASVKLAVAGLHSRFTAANGSAPNLLKGGTTADTSDKFESIAQLKVAMSDPQYRTDPAYRAKVQAKLERSNVL